jgi:polyhydroxyalkanoate synthesis regulator phasin
MNERLRILEMVKEGKITPEDGLRLIDELEDRPSGDPSRTVRVHVRDPGGRKVQVALPARLATTIAAMIPEKTRARLIEKGINIDELLKAVQQSTARGPIVDLRDPGGTVVEVIVE